MKRLVICCDGTWNAPDNANITNIEKIARSIETHEPAAGVQQLVEYVQGVGVGYRTDRLLGGAFGFGLFSNVRTAYRFLALNYEPGDEIFVFGFSRGAYTARSVAGMVGYVGLLTGDALVDGRLKEALDLYRMRDKRDAASDERRKQFKAVNCHPKNPIAFLGVFDTVGALGVPGSVLFPEHRFHDIDLGAHVNVARQALAIDERRMTFAPCLWTVPSDENGMATVCPGTSQEQQVDRVKQVWFPGVHSDVGGGYPENGLSCTTLKWMTDEAKVAGLVFDDKRLGFYLDRARPPKLNDSLTWGYRLVNLRERLLPRRDVRPGTFVDGLRNLEPAASPMKDKPAVPMVLPVRLASTARADFDDPSGDYRPDNVAAYVDRHTPPVTGRDAEEVVRMPLQAAVAGAAPTPAAPGSERHDPESDVTVGR